VCVELVHRLVKDSDIVGINAPEWYVERMNRAIAQWRQHGNVGALWGIHSSSSSSSSTLRHGEFGNGMILVIYQDGRYKRGKAFLEHCRAFWCRRKSVMPSDDVTAAWGAFVY
jgi:ABC-type branched-subunit amino acid transport system substrate-binding protein